MTSDLINILSKLLVVNYKLLRKTLQSSVENAKIER